MPSRNSFTIKSMEIDLKGWLEDYASVSTQAEALYIRQNMVTLLDFVRDNKVVGTQSAGNLPLKAIREMTARFIDPPELDTAIGDHVYKLRSEEEVWPLYFLRIVAEVGGLIKTGRSRRWQLTARGRQFLEKSFPLQACYLLAVWWHKIDWLVAYPFVGMGDRLPYFFSHAVLTNLLELPTGKSVSFNIYADKLIRNTGLTWTAPDRSYAASALRSAIEKMVVDVLKDFGGLACRYQEEPLGRGTITELDEIEVTQWGKALLKAVAITGGYEPVPHKVAPNLYLIYTRKEKNIL
jgi:hypothetical protein